MKLDTKDPMCYKRRAQRMILAECGGDIKGFFTRVAAIPASSPRPLGSRHPKGARLSKKALAILGFTLSRPESKSLSARKKQTS